MNRNAKIALGCGGAGCLGLIVVAVASVLVYLFMAQGSNTNTSTNRRTGIEVNANTNTRTNRNSNSNDSAERDDNANSSSSSSSMSNDDQHRLFHAATVSGDPELVRRVQKKLGLLSSDNMPNEKNVDFATDHVSWAFNNTDFVQEINTQAKGRAYVEAHIND